MGNSTLENVIKLVTLRATMEFTQPHTNTSGKNHSASKKTFVLKLTCFNVLQQVAHMAAGRCFNCNGYAVNKMKSGVKVGQCHCDVSSSQLLFA